MHTYCVLWMNLNILEVEQPLSSLSKEARSKVITLDVKFEAAVAPADDGGNDGGTG